MKNNVFCLIMFFLIGLHALAQKNNTFHFYYGTSDAKFFQNGGVDGAGNVDVKNFSEIGLRFIQNISGNLAFESGISYSFMNVVIEPAFMGIPVKSRKEKLEFVSVPIFVNYTLWDHLFFNGGPIIDFQTTDTSVDTQSGVGYGLGIGGKYSFNDFVFFINPNFKKHAVISFERENNQQRLTEIGIQLGLGYQF